MPKLPRGVFKREGRGYYMRKRVNGKPRWICLGSTPDEARQRLHEGRLSGASSVRSTVSQMADRWLGERIELTRTPEGQIKARTRARLYLGPCLGHKLIGKLAREDAWAYRRWLESHERELSPQSVHHVLSDLRAMLRWCEDMGLLERSPFPRGVMPRLQERPPDRLEPDEVAAVLTIPEPYAFVVRLGLGTGLRWGELTRAQASDVQKGVLVVHHTKSRKVRRVPLPAGLRDELRSRVGKLVQFVESGAFANQVRKHSGVKRFHVHQLRHSFACTWLERGGSLAALQQLLGHSSIVTTQRYGRISDDMVRAEVERVSCVPSCVPSVGTGSDEGVVWQQDGGIAKW
jgi:integrase